MSEEANESVDRFEFHPAWSYQWLAIAGTVSLALAAVFIARGDVLPVPLARMALAALAALAGYMALLVLYRRYAWHFSIDSERLDSRQGIIGRRLRSVRISDLRNIYVRQSAGQRLLGVGDVDFCGPDNEVEVTFFGVPDPMGLRNQVQAWQTGVVSRLDPPA